MDNIRSKIEAIVDSLVHMLNRVAKRWPVLFHILNNACVARSVPPYLKHKASGLQM